MGSDSTLHQAIKSSISISSSGEESKLSRNVTFYCSIRIRFPYLHVSIASPSPASLSPLSLFFLFLSVVQPPPLPLLALGLLPGLDQSLPPGRLGHLLTCRRPLLSHLILLLCVLFCFPFSFYGCGLSSPHAIFLFDFVFVFFIEIFPPSWPSSLSPPSFRVLTYTTFPSAHHVPLPSYTPDSMLHRGGEGVSPVTWISSHTLYPQLLIFVTTHSWRTIFISRLLPAPSLCFDATSLICAL